MNTEPVRFRFTGPVAAGFDAIRREIHPGEEFDVPVELALSFANHGHCEPLDPDRIAALRQAEADAQAAQDQERLAAMRKLGLTNAHPSAPQPPAAAPAPAARTRTAKADAAPVQPAAQ